MTYEQYWYGDPLMIRAFFKAYKLKKQCENELAWLNGLYTFKALEVALNNAFYDPKKGGRRESYPSQPLELNTKDTPTSEEQEKNRALAYMTSMVNAGRNWGKH